MAVVKCWSLFNKRGNSTPGQEPSFVSDRYGAVNLFTATKPDTRHTPQTSPCPFFDVHFSSVDFGSAALAAARGQDKAELFFPKLS